MKPVILFRGSLAEEEELAAARKHFDVYENRAAVPSGSLVIGRYSCLPWYKELEEDLKYNSSKLINSHIEHCYVANIRNWYYDLGDYTPRTWFYLDQVDKKEAPFVLKGATNSKKFNWNTHMFAETWYDAQDVYHRLSADGYVGYQDICIRKYIPLKKLQQGLNGLPISEEYRIFVLNGKVISAGFYWSNFVDELESEIGGVESIPANWLASVIDTIKDKITFFVVDVARTADGGWIVVELNDAQQSGLSCISPEIFYRSLSEAF